MRGNMRESTGKTAALGRRFAVLCSVLAVLTVLAGLISLGLGRFSRIGIFDIPQLLFHWLLAPVGDTSADTNINVLIHLRLPRIIASIVVGASLAMSGVAYQSLFSNPIASSDTLGVTASAAFGAVLGMLLGIGTFWVKLTAFAFGCAVVMGVFVLASKLSQGRNLTVFLILIGMIASSLFQALLSVLKFVADPIDELPKITYWLMGSLGNVQLKDLPFCIAFFIIGSAPLFLLRWRLNILSLSDYEAKSMGENINGLRLTTVVCATLLTSSAVAMTGGISWVGLVIPHIGRFIVGPDSRRLLPASALMGALFLLIMDDIARCATVYELPISVLTSLFGAPVFFAILIKTRRQMSSEN